MHALQQQFQSLTALSGKSYWFSTEPKDLFFLVLDPSTKVTNVRLKLLTPQEGFPSLWYPLPLMGLFLEMWVPTRLPLLLSYQTMCGSFLITVVVEKPTASL